MQDQSPQLTYEVELRPGEKLALPASLVESVGPGRWMVTIQPLPKRLPDREHSAFLRSYAPEDEGLYDDCATR